MGPFSVHVQETHPEERGREGRKGKEGKNPDAQFHSCAREAWSLASASAFAIRRLWIVPRVWVWVTTKGSVKRTQCVLVSAIQTLGGSKK